MTRGTDAGTAAILELRAARKVILREGMAIIGPKFKLVYPGIQNNNNNLDKPADRMADRIFYIIIRVLFYTI